MDDEEDNIPLKSIHTREKSYVQFINTTNYIVEVYWVSYEGKFVLYAPLRPSDSLKINTYVTHPWLFVEKDTRDRFMVEGETVFFPQPWFTHYRGMPRDQLPERIERVKVFITLPIYSLRDISLRVIKRLLRDDIHAFKLDIPSSLQLELASMPPKKALKESSDIE